MKKLDKNAIEKALNLDQLNREQELAVLFDKHTFISANAGSGKTSVIIKKYIYELLTNEIVDNNPENIVAITFTNKAASEMTKRTYDLFEKLIDDEGLDSASKNKIYSIYKKLSKSRISTIHRFCLSLISEYPIEANLVPGYKSGDSKLIQNKIDEIISNILKDIINNKLTNNDEYELLKKYGISTISDALKKIYYSRDLIDCENAKLTEDKYNEIFERYKAFVLWQLNRIVDIYDNGLEYNIDKIKKTNKNTKYEDVYNLFISTLTRLKRLISVDFDSLDFEEIASTLFSLKINESYSNSRIHNVAYYEDNNYFSDKVSFVDSFIALSKSISSNIVNNNKDLVIKETNAISSITCRFLKEVDEFKHNENIIDFDDILIIADKLLDKEHIIKDVRSKIKLLMVDEFQDTSHIQYNIVKKIIGDGNLNEVKLVLVGDEKQSIYGFRNAEIEIFKESKDFVKDLNDPLKFSQKGFNNQSTHSKLNSLSDEEKLGVIELKTSYRMSPYLVSFMNKINNVLFELNKDINYAQYFEEIVNKNKTQYSDFVYGVKSDKTEYSFDKSNIEYDEAILENQTQYNIYENNEDENEGESLSEIECKAKYVLQRIKKIKSQSQNNFSWSDIAIVARTKNTFELISKKLDEANIPNVVHTKFNLYDKREIKDIYLFLKFIESPYYDLNLAGLLKSYFFNFNDSEIFNLMSLSSKEGNSLLDKLKVAADDYTNEEYNKKIKFTLECLHKALDNYVIFEFPSLINFLIENSYFKQSAKHLNSEAEFEESVNFFINEIHNYQENYSYSLTDIVDYVFEQICAGEKEQQLEANIKQDMINILTIHSSKGLEFKYVIYIIESKQSLGRNEKLSYSKSLSNLVFKTMKVEENESDNMLYELNSYEQKIKDFYDEIRLCYVAMSRAEKGLYFIDSKKKNSKGEISDKRNFLSREIYNYFKIKDNLNTEIKFENEKILIQEKNTQKEQKISYKFIWNRIEDAQQEKEDNLNTAHIQVVGEERVMLSDEVSIEITKEDFTATKFKNILTYKNPDDYFQRYILGVPDFVTDKMQYIENFEGVKVADPIEKGNNLHYLMERIKDWLDKDLQIKTEIVDKILDELNCNENDKGYYFDVINNFAESELMKVNDKNLANFINELRIKIPLEKSYLSCIVDLCFKDSNGYVEIWDWKSDTILNDKELKEKTDMYNKQLKSYVYACYYYFRKPEKITTRVLFLDMLAKDESNKDWIQSVEYSKEDIQPIYEELVRELKKANKMNFGIE